MEIPKTKDVANKTPPERIREVKNSDAKINEPKNESGGRVEVPREKIVNKDSGYDIFPVDVGPSVRD